MSLARSLHLFLPRRLPRQLRTKRFYIYFPTDAQVDTPLDLSGASQLGVGVVARIKSYDPANARSIITEQRTWWIRVPKNNDYIWFGGYDQDGVLWTINFGIKPNDVIGIWLYLFGNYDGVNGVLEVFLNGKLVGSKAIPAKALWTPLKADSAVVALMEAGAELDVAVAWVYGRPLKQWEIQHNMVELFNPVRSGLKLFLLVEEGAGTTLTDLSGNGNNGTITGPAVWKTLASWELRAEVGL